MTTYADIVDKEIEDLTRKIRNFTTLIILSGLAMLAVSLVLVPTIGWDNVESDKLSSLGKGILWAHVMFLCLGSYSTITAEKLKSRRKDKLDLKSNARYAENLAYFDQLRYRNPMQPNLIWIGLDNEYCVKIPKEYELFIKSSVAGYCSHHHIFRFILETDLKTILEANKVNTVEVKKRIKL